MKKLRNLIMVLLVMVLVSGCKLKAEYNMQINKDKSGSFNIIVAMDDELLETMLAQEDENATSKEYTDEDKWKYLDSMFNDDESSPEAAGFTVNKYEKDKFKGYEYFIKIDNIDDYSGKEASFDLDDLANFKESKIFVKDGNKYKAKITFDMDDLNTESYQGIDLSSIYDMKFIVTLPDKPISSNATTVSEDGKTLTWDLTKLDDKGIEFEFELAKDNTILYVGIGVALVILVVIILVIVLTKKNSKPTMVDAVSQQPMNMMPNNNPMPVTPTPDVTEQPLTNNETTNSNNMMN